MAAILYCTLKNTIQFSIVITSTRNNYQYPYSHFASVGIHNSFIVKFVGEHRINGFLVIQFTILQCCQHYNLHHIPNPFSNHSPYTRLRFPTIPPLPNIIKFNTNSWVFERCWNGLEINYRFKLCQYLFNFHSNPFW